MRVQEQLQPSIRRTPFENHALRWLAELEGRVGVLRQLLNDELGATICERCHRNWFLALPWTPGGPTGDARGLTVAGTAYCAVCVDTLYSFTAAMDSESACQAFTEVAHWLNRYPTALPPTSPWVQDPSIQELRRKFEATKRVRGGRSASKRVLHLVSVKNGHRRLARAGTRR